MRVDQVGRLAVLAGGVFFFFGVHNILQEVGGSRLARVHTTRPALT